MTLKTARDAEGPSESGGQRARANGRDPATASRPSEDLSAAVQLLQSLPDTEFDAEWHKLDRRYPGDPGLWAAWIQRLIKRKAYDEAVAAIESHKFEEAHNPLSLCQKAELLYDARAPERAEQVFSALIAQHPKRRDFRISYAKRLFADGALVRANALLWPIRDSFAEGSKSRSLAEKVAWLTALLTSLEGAPLDPDEDARIIAMKHAILRFRDRDVRVRATDGLGRLTLITGGLGPGGAERQLTRLAMELERARRTAGSIAGIPLDQPVEVVVRSHTSDKQNDFYLADIQSANVELKQINDFDVVSPRALGIDDPVLAQLLDYLPPSVNWGVRRLTEHLRESGTDTASVWQDGACLFAGLAALIAGVPHIQLAIRGLPPSVRRHMYRPEYQAFYRAMAQVPGVYFVSNNISAARAYADWLDISLDRFSIVYNGVEPMSPEPSRECRDLWRKFEADTAGASHTVGGVFRFDTDKQPLLWIRFAARYLKRHPDARIVLVGGGRLLDHAIKLAEDYGISERVLFVGRSTHVGYWMTKMDVLVLLSRYEGLPNVLIEAQYMGVRVVTTPAGGAAECLIDGTTGHVLGCAERPDYQQIVDMTHDLAMQSGDRALFAPGGVGRTFLDSHFSIPHMLVQYVTCTSNGLGPMQLQHRQAARSLRAA